MFRREKATFVSLMSTRLRILLLAGGLELGLRPGKTVTRGNQEGKRQTLAAYDFMAISHLDIRRVFSAMTFCSSNSTHANAPATAMGAATTVTTIQTTVMAFEAVRRLNR